VINEFGVDEQSGWVELFNQSERERSLRDYALAAKHDGRNWLFPMGGDTSIAPGEFHVVSFHARSTGKIGEWESGNASFPGIRSEGGFIALVREFPRSNQQVGDQEGRHETIEDFYFYGPLKNGQSYGRLQGEFQFMKTNSGNAQ
jgi:hypothetical protein